MQITEKQTLIGHESPGNCKALCDILPQRFAPVDDLEYGLIEELAVAYWRLRRAWALETKMLENAMRKQIARRHLAPANRDLRKRTQNPLSLQRIYRRNPLETRPKRLPNRPKSPDSASSPANLLFPGNLLTTPATRSLKNSRMELTDLGFVTKARAGDADAYRVLVERHSRALFRLAFRMTGNEQDAEDVVQESFLRAYRQLAKFDERASFGTWLYRIAVNASLDLVRSRKRRNEQLAPVDPEMDDPVLSLPSHDPTPDRLALSGEVRDRVTEAMNELSASERTAFVLRHFEGMCIEDVSRVLGCQPGAAKHSVFRAVQKLRRALEPLVAAR